MSDAARWALFLDVDGTLLDIAPTPEDVVVDAGLPGLLARLRDALQGAVALVSGRPIATLDRLFAPHCFAAAGVHGIERRDAAGRCHFMGLAPDALDPARLLLREFAGAHPGLRLEDKGRSLALHWRQAPALAAEALAAAHRALEASPSEFHLQEGRCVIEIKSRAATKGTAVEQFLEEPPFKDRLPVMLGDDVTDEDGFALIEARGGLAIEVGGAHARGGVAGARARNRRWLADPRAVQTWLSGLAAQLARRSTRETRR